MRALRGMIAGGLGLLAAIAGCSGKQEPAHGELMVALSSDMSVPKDVTHIRVDILVNAAVAYQYDFQISPDGTFHLPGTLAIVAGKQESPTVSVEVIGIRDKGNGQKEARTFSKAVTTVPKSRIALLRVPVQWLCDKSALPVGDGYASTCDPVNGEEAACAAGTCTPVAKDESKLGTFDASEVFGGAPGPNLGFGRCFDTLGCLQGGQDAFVETDCSISVPDGTSSPNVGIVLGPGGDGICPKDAAADCFVPLDQDDELGWRYRDPNATTGRIIDLPQAVCARLRDASAKAVRLSGACPTKTPEIPTCGPWSSVMSLADGGTMDSGTMDSGTMDSGTMDSGTMDSGTMDSGTMDAGPDAMPTDSGSDGGLPPPKDSGGGGTGAGPPDSAAPPPGCTDPLSFADPTLEADVRASIGMPTGPITASFAAGVANLNFSDPNLSTIDGIQCFANVQYLSINSTQVSDLSPIGTYTVLNRIDAGYDKIVDLTPLVTIQSLTMVDFMGNQIIDVAPLAQLSNLTSVGLDSNQITDPSPLSTLTNLTSLRIQDNPIAGAAILSAVSGMTQLQELKLPSGGITDLSPLAGLTNLQNVSVAGNMVSDLSPLAGLTQLWALDIQSNMVTDLSPLASVPIRDLYIRQNPITSLSGLIPLSATLTTLDATACPLFDVNSDLMLLGSMTNLTDLTLYSDNINDISVGQLSGLTNLIHLGLSANAITDASVVQNMTQLQFLGLDSNQLVSIAPLVNNPGLAQGDTVFIQNNPMLPCGADVDALRSRGVSLTTDCP